MWNALLMLPPVWSGPAWGRRERSGLGGRVAPVHGQGDPGDETSLVARQIENRRRDVFGLAEAAQGMTLKHRLLPGRIGHEGPGHGRLDDARTHAIHADLWRPGQRHRPGEVDHPALRR